MKNWLLIVVFSALSYASWGQYTWSKISDVNPNPEFTNPMSKMDWLMINNKGYHIYDSVSNFLKLSVYKPETGTWQFLARESVGASLSDLRSYYFNNKIYTVVLTFDGLIIYEYDLATNDFVQMANNTGSFAALSSYFSTAYSSVSNSIYITVVDNGTNVQMMEYSISAQSLSTSVNLTPTINPSNYSVFGRIPMYTSNAYVYVGLSSPSFKLGRAPLTGIASFGPYNSGGSNNGVLYLNGSAILNGYYLLSGNGQNEPNLIYNDITSNLSYSKPVSTTDINIVAGTDTPISWNVGNSDNAVLAAPAYEFVMSEFSSQSQSTMDKFYVYRKDVSSGIWDSIGPKIEFTQPYLNANSARMSLENVNSLHLGIMYRSTASNGGASFAVLNKKPIINPSSIVANTGLCFNNNNIIYPELVIYDDDIEKVRIISVTSTNGLLSNMTALPIGYDPSASPAISKFKISGFASATGTTQVIVTYTDGWNQFSDTLPVISIGATIPTLSFTPATPVFCSNENLIDLTNYVSYSDLGGEFKINGQVVGSTQSATSISAISSSGTIEYKVPINGCVVSATSGYFIATVGTAVASATSTSCGATNGTASVNFTAGTGGVQSVEWSTGESTSNISGLAPGAYYYNVTDVYGCHVTGFTNVSSLEIAVNATVTQPTCAGANNGVISATVAGPTNYSMVWSNGYSTSSISNLAPGTYWLTVTDLTNGCQATSEYTINSPTPLHATFSTYDPDCGIANGVIYGNYSGGNGGYTYNWLGQGQTTPDLSGVTYGLYQVEVMDLTGCKDTFNYQLNDYQAVTLNESVINASCGMNNGAILMAIFENGTTLNTVSWNNGTETPSNFNLASGDYTITAVSGPSLITGLPCYAQKTVHVGLAQPAKQEICIVTVDTATTTNVVVWEETNTYNIAYYNIYRENTVAGEYMLIDTVQVGSLSAFNDVVASPKDKSWRYKIAAVDVCGTESPISSTHKTLHLNTIDVLANGSVDILWDDYEGNNSAANYVVWRHTDALGWQALPASVPLGTTYYNETPPVGSTGLDYFIEMVLDFPCTATKAQDFNTTRSNRDKGAFSAGSGTGNSNNGLEELTETLSYYPNPTNAMVTFELTEAQMGMELELISINGVVLKTIQTSSLTVEVNLDELSNGMYYFKWKDGSTVFPIVKN